MNFIQKAFRDALVTACNFSANEILEETRNPFPIPMGDLHVSCAYNYNYSAYAQYGLSLTTVIDSTAITIDESIKTLPSGEK